MIRVFKPTDRDFTSNGDAVIVPIKARVKNNMNGEFFIELTCESKFYKYLDQGNIIITPTPQGEQAFRIDNQLSRKGERITIKARHVFYDAEKLVVADSYAVDLNCEQALRHFNAATDSLSPFTMHSDITSLNSFRCVRKSLAEAIGTVIERWGGYLVRNNWDISVNKSVGRDYGVTIRYAKNLKELTASYDFSGVATKLLPVGKDGILLPELYVSSAKQYSIPYTKVVSIQQDINEDDYSTEEEYQAAVIADLRTQAQALVNKTCIPVITYTLKGNPEKVQDIGDVIEVIDERIGVNITTQVIGYEWDVITEQYASLTFGNFGNTLSGLMAKVNADTKGVVNEAVGEVKTEFKSSINNIYDLLQGSYVLYRGYDILLLDRIPAGTAQNVIKFSKDGISVSSNGINGDFKEVYNIATKKLSVPSISLNGKDLQNTLDDKISYANLKAGNNITITRKGKILTINGTGKNGNTVLAGVNVPADSLGDEHDLYLQVVQETNDVINDTDINIPSWGGNYGELLNFVRISRNKFSFAFRGTPDNRGYGETIYFTMHGLVKGNQYTISFKGQYSNGTTFPWGYQDYATVSGTGVESQVCYFVKDFNINNYSFTFTAGEDNTMVLTFPAVQDDTQFTFTVTDLLIDGDYVAGIQDLYGKIDGKWQKYDGGETYEAGEHITIVDGVISANYSPFTGATAQQAGAAGLVPAPAETDVDKVLGAGGNWVKNGTKVEANPADNASGTLTKLGIDGTVYEVQGGGGGSNLIVDAQIYSLEEKQIGVWVDGRPLYQKTFIRNITLSSGSWITTGDSILNGKAIDAEVTAIDQSSDTVPVWCKIGADGHIELLNIRGSGYVTITHYTVRYFKTTDKVGSGGFQAYGFTPIIYSTEEREVGVWIDNKPLYQKTFDCGALLNAQTKEISFTEDMETATIIDAFAMSTNEGYIISIPDVVPNYVAGSVRIYISKTNKKIYIYSQTDMRTYDKSYVTIQYTKTTDVAGSGSYTTLGVPAVHYTTDEQVIGTWIDGTSVYKKVVVLPSPNNISYDSWQPMGVSITGGDKVLSCFGVATDGTNSPLHAYFETFGVVTCQTPRNNSISYNIEYLIIEYTKTTD